jgi:hypothetical protein
MLDMYDNAKRSYVTAAAGVSDSDFRDAIKDRVVMQALMQRMGAIDCTPSFPAPTHRKPQVGPDDEAAILVAIGQARESNNVARRLEPHADTYRDPAGLVDLADYKVDSSPPALAKELKAILRGLHSSCDAAMLKLPVPQLKRRVLECLPSAARPIGSVTLAEAVDRIWEGPVQALVEKMPDAPTGYQAAGMTAPEKDVLAQLQKLEAKKGKASTKLHPRFTNEKQEPAIRVRNVQLGKLSKAQVNQLLRYYKVTRPDDIDEEAAAQLLVTAMAAQEGERPVRELERSLRKAMQLVLDKKQKMALHYGRSTRCINQIWGEFGSPKWKAWCGTHSMLNLRMHYHGGVLGHRHCSRFVWYGGGCQQQACGPPSLQEPDIAVSWSRFDVAAAKGVQPAGISAQAQLLIVMLVLSGEFQKRMESTISFLRSSSNENFNSCLNQFTPMQINASDQQGAPLGDDLHTQPQVPQVLTCTLSFLCRKSQP